MKSGRTPLAWCFWSTEAHLASRRTDSRTAISSYALRWEADNTGRGKHILISIYAAISSMNTAIPNMNTAIPNMISRGNACTKFAKWYNILPVYVILADRTMARKDRVLPFTSK